MKNEIKYSVAGVFFYVVSVIFLAIAVFYIAMTYQVVAENGGLDIGLTNILNAYFTSAAPFFAYAIACYGLGVIMGKLTALTEVMKLCVEDVEEELEGQKEEIETEQEDTQENKEEQTEE